MVVGSVNAYSQGYTSKFINKEKLKFILATDLDGTFLGGSDKEREELYHLIRTRRDEIFLIFLTGRSVDAVLPVLSDQLIPTPDILVADVGATVVDGTSLEPLWEVQVEIAQHWPSETRILAELERFSALTRQPVPQDNRVSFYVDEDKITDEIKDIIQNSLRCNMIFSDGKYLDVLPGGVSKGTTLMRLLRLLELPKHKVLVAGDTCNDLSLFETNCYGVAVANSEESLREQIKSLSNVFEASRNGAAGILEALVHHHLLDSDYVDTFPNSEPVGEFDFIVACHRLPFSETREKDGTVTRSFKSPNGLIATLLRFFDGGKPGLWVAATQAPSRGQKMDAHVPVDEERFPELKAARIPLTEKDIDVFHKRFCKEALWPVIFSFPGKAEFRYQEWNHYVEINRIFADRIAAEAAENAVIWFHDYPLWMVPYFLREKRPDVKMTFFHHTTFPSADIFNMLPWSREIITSLLQCDYIAFHIPRYVENFVDVVKAHVPAKVTKETSCSPRFVSYGCSLGLDVMPTEIEVNNRLIGLGAHPVGVDAAQIAAVLKQEKVRERIQELRYELNGTRCILSLERLDYVKGPIHKLLAFEKLLSDHPELHERITLINICTPPPPGQRSFNSTRKQVDEVVGRINGKFSRVGWTPVQYFYRSLPFEEVVAYYAVADVAWVTPLRDGLNLVAKEFVVAQSEVGNAGVLVISEFAGASVELQGAVLTNPYEVNDMSNRLAQALSLKEQDRKQRMESLADTVLYYDLNRWIEEYMAGLANYTKV